MGHVNSLAAELACVYPHTDLLLWADYVTALHPVLISQNETRRGPKDCCIDMEGKMKHYYKHVEYTTQVHVRKHVATHVVYLASVYMLSHRCGWEIK